MIQNTTTRFSIAAVEPHGRPSRDGLPCRSIDNQPSGEHPGSEGFNVCSTEFDVAAAWNERGKRNTDSGRDAAANAEMRPRL